MKSRLITLLLALTVAGCSTIPTSTTPITMQSGKPVPAARIYQAELTVPSPGHTAKVSFLRDAGVLGSACTHKILVNGQPVFAILSGEYQTLYLAPGQYLFRLEIEGGLCPKFSASHNAVLSDGAEETYRILTPSPTSSPQIAIMDAPTEGSRGSSVQPPQDRRSLSKVIYDDCMPVRVMMSKKKGESQDSTLVDHLYCQVTSGMCRDYPGSEDCKRGARSIDRDRYGAGPSQLFLASSRGDATIVRGLLESGFDPNANIGGPAWPGWTPVMIAAAEGHEAIVRTLLDAGADPNARNSVGRTPLMLASIYGRLSIVTMLLGKGANPNLVPDDGTGWTALMASAYRGHAEVVALLLRSGATQSAVDSKGKTALGLAEAEGHSEVVRILREHGAAR